MKSGAFVLLGGMLAVAGCSSQAATGSSPAPTPTATHSVAATSVPAATVDPQPTAALAVKSTPAAVPAAGTAFQRGETDLRNRNYAAAKQDFQQAIAAHQHLANSYTGLGTASFELGDFPGAYRAYRSAAALVPTNPAILYYTAYAALRTQDFHATVSYATRYIHLRPRDVNGYQLRLLAYGHLYMQKPQLSDARTIVSLRPHDPGAYNDLGMALSNDGHYQPAVQAFTRAIQLLPSNDGYYTNRAIAENLNKQPKLALRDLYTARSLATDPLTRKQLDEAIANLKKHMQQ